MMIMKQSESIAARRRLPVYLVDDTDGKTPETGVTVSGSDIKISKNGGARTDYGGTWTEMSAGWYTYEFTAGELDTLGFVSFDITKTGVRIFPDVVQVVPWDPYLNQDSEIAGLPDAILDVADGVETNYTMRQSLRLILAAMVGKLSGALGPTTTIRDVNDTKNRIVASVDSTGRTSVTKDAS